MVCLGTLWAFGNFVCAFALYFTDSFYQWAVCAITESSAFCEVEGLIFPCLPFLECLLKQFVLTVSLHLYYLWEDWARSRPHLWWKYVDQYWIIILELCIWTNKQTLLQYPSSPELYYFRFSSNNLKWVFSGRIFQSFEDAKFLKLIGYKFIDECNILRESPC